MGEDFGKNYSLIIEDGQVVNNNPYVSLGEESDDLVKIIVAIFDLEGFTDFFNSITINKNIVVSSFMRGLLSWIHYRFEPRQKDSIPPPTLAKFLGDGIMYVWEPSRRKVDVVPLMNMCYNLTESDSRYEKQFLTKFKAKIGKRWKCNYPSRLRVGLSLGHAVKYKKGDEIVDYISECINIASRLVKCHPEIYFAAHSDILIGQPAEKHNYVEKHIKLRGIKDPISIFLDKNTFEQIVDKMPFVEPE